MGMGWSFKEERGHRYNDVLLTPLIDFKIDYLSLQGRIDAEQRRSKHLMFGAPFFIYEEEEYEQS